MEKQYEELAKLSKYYLCNPALQARGAAHRNDPSSASIAHFSRILIFIGEISWGRNPSPYGPYSLTP
jgi:hypothetical protein